MTWTRDGYSSAFISGEYRIEQVWAPGGSAWFITGPNGWVGGTVPTMREAKADCAQHVSDTAHNLAFRK